MALIRDGSRRAPCEPWGRSGRPRRARPRRSKVSSTIPAPASCTSRCEPRPRRQSDAAPRSPISAKARRPRSSRDRHRHGRSGSPVKPAPHRLLHRLLAARPASVRARYLAATRSEPSSARKAGSWTCRRTQPVGTERASPEPRKGLLLGGARQIPLRETRCPRVWALEAFPCPNPAQNGRNRPILWGVRGGVLRAAFRMASGFAGGRPLDWRQCRQAGGHWFEPSTAHS
jgi:hypothetical protein